MTADNVWRTISYKQWVKEFKPFLNPIQNLPDNFDPRYFWTEIESDGVYTISSGMHLVNRTGNYYMSELPHDFNVELKTKTIKATIGEIHRSG